MTQIFFFVCIFVLIDVDELKNSKFYNFIFDCIPLQATCIFNRIKLLFIDLLYVCDAKKDMGIRYDMNF